MGNTSNNKWIKTWSIVQDEQAGAHYLVSGGDVMGKPRRRHQITERSRLECTLLVSITLAGLSHSRIGLVKNIADVYK